MANDNTNMEINIEAQNDTESGFSGLTGSIESLQSTIERLTETFSQFSSNVDRSMNGAKEAMESLSSTADSAMNTVTTSSEEAARGMESSLDNAAKQSASAIEDSMRSATDSIDSIGKSTDNVTHTMDSMASSASKSFDDIGKASAEAAQTIERDVESASNNASKSFDDMSKHINDSVGSIQKQMTAMFAGMSFQSIAQPLQNAVGSAIKTYQDFDQAVANVNSMMGLTPPQVTSLKNQLIDLSKVVPEGPTALANALYGVVGAGVPANEAMDVLNVSSKAATAGQTDLGTATNALIAVMDSYGLKASSLGKISDQMFAANQAGAMTFDSFAKSIGNVAGPAAQVGISFDQVAAATAALTNQGLSAQRATQGLRSLLIGITAPTAGATKEAKALGIEWDQSALKSKGLVGMLQEAMKATGGNSEELKKLIPNIAAWTVATDLGGKGAQSYKQAMDTMAKSAGSTNSAMEEQEKGFDEQMKKMQASIEMLKITFVESFGPSLSKAVEGLTSLIKAFTNLSPAMKNFIGIALLSTLGISTLLEKIFFARAGFLALADGIAPLIGKLGGIGGAVKNATAAFANMSIGGNLFKGLISGLESLGNGIRTLIFGPWALLKNGITSLPGLIANIPGKFSALGSGIINAFTKIPSLFGTLKNVIFGFGSGIIQLAPKILMAFRSAFSIQGIMTGARAALTLLTGPWGILILAIVAGVGAIIKNWDSIKAWVQQHFGGTLPTNFKQFQQIFSQVWQSVKDIFSQVWNSMKQVATEVWNYIGPTITGGIKQVQEFWNQVWPEIKQVFVEVWNVMKVIIGPAVMGIYLAVVTALGILEGAWGDIWNAIKDTLKLVWDAITGVIKVAWDIISGVIKVGLDLLTGHWGQAWNDFKSIFVNVWHDLGSLISNVAKDALNWGKDIIQGIIHGIQGGISALGNAVSNIASTIKSYLHFSVPDVGPLADFDTYMPDMMKGLSEGMTNNISKVKSAATNVAQTLKNALIPSNVSVVGSTAVQGSSSTNNITDAIVSALKTNSSSNTTNNTYNNNGNEQQPTYLIMDKQKVGKIITREVDLNQDVDTKMRLRGTGH